MEETGKLPSELATGPRGDPANVAPMVAYLASDAASIVNGRFFSVRGYQISLHSPWEIAAILRAERRWEPEEIDRLIPETFAPMMTLPEAAEVPGRDRPARGTAVWQADDSTWKTLAPGVELWERERYFEAKK